MSEDEKTPIERLTNMVEDLEVYYHHDKYCLIPRLADPRMWVEEVEFIVEDLKSLEQQITDQANNERDLLARVEKLEASLAERDERIEKMHERIGALTTIIQKGLYDSYVFAAKFFEDAEVLTFREWLERELADQEGKSNG